MTINDVKKEGGKINGKEILLYAKELMASEEIDHHESDLYLKVNEVSKGLKQNYAHEWTVSTFIDNINHELWYEFPFCYWEEQK